MVDKLRFNFITCKNFMPYYNETISFPKEDGVLIVNGNNGHGKSSLIAAIRFVLFGSYSGNAPGEDMSIFKIINADGFKSGKYSCEVTLDVDYLGNEYKIIRSCSPKIDGVEPKLPSDYGTPSLNVISISEGRALLPKEQEKLLSKIMNEKVSRFYLFDGELLDEYNRILSGKKANESEKIKTAIENILGLPILTNSISHLSKILDEKKKDYAEAAKRTEETETYGNLLQTEEAKRIKNEDALKKWRNDLENWETLRDKYEDELRNHAEDLEISAKFAAQKRELEENKNEANKLKEDRAFLLEDAWRVLLYPSIENRLKNYQEEESVLKTQIENITSKRELITNLQDSLRSECCKWCEQEIISEKAKETIIKRIDDVENELNSLPSIDCVNERMISIREDIKKGKSIINNYNPSLLEKIRSNSSQLQDKLDKIVERELMCDNLKKQLSDTVDKDQLNKLNSDQKKAIEQIVNCKNTIENLTKEHDDIQKNIDAIGKRINESSYASRNTDLEKANRAISVLKDLSKLFDNGIAEYREDKRILVEKSASEIYCKLSEARVGGLHISDKYTVERFGLDKEILPPPSSGYAHLEAFALIGGLHQNIPIKGPLFMDTPSSRLDSANTSNLIRTLPDLSSQIILLITDKDFNSKELHSSLKDNIIAEYNIVKISETHSEIKEVSGEVT